MFALNAVMVLISAAVLFSLALMRQTFRPIEKIVYYMVIVISIEQIHSAILDNFQLIQFSQSVSAFIFYKMNQLLVFPIFTMWLLYSFFQPKLHASLKIVFIFVWGTLLSIAYTVFQAFGIFELTGWNYGYSIVIWYVVLLESLTFCFIFRNMLRKSEDHDPLPT